MPLIPIAIGIRERRKWLIRVGIGKGAAPLFQSPPPHMTGPVAEHAEARMVKPDVISYFEHLQIVVNSKWQGHVLLILDSLLGSCLLALISRFSHLV